MSAAVCGKRAASSFDDQQQLLPHATASPLPPSKRARLRGAGGNPSPPPPRPRGSGADPALVDAIRARFPAASLEVTAACLDLLHSVLLRLPLPLSPDGGRRVSVWCGVVKCLLLVSSHPSVRKSGCYARSDPSPRPLSATATICCGRRSRCCSVLSLCLLSVPALGSKFIEKALEECGNHLDSTTKFLLNQHGESAECYVAVEYQSPVGMSTEGQVPAEGTTPYAGSLPSSSTQWVDIFVNEMAAASDPGDAKARASRVLEVFERSITSNIGTEPLQSLKKENSICKEQFEAVIKENTILKRAVAIQHERQKEHEERCLEYHELKQMVVQYQEQVRSLEVNNYALSMHLRQAQQGSSIPGHFNRHIF